MKLGVLVNTDRHLDLILGLTEAAAARGHEVLLFAMDTGTHLMREPRYLALRHLPGVRLSLCEHSAAHHQVSTAGLPEEITCGSQLQNAMMHHQADRVVVL